MRLIIILLILFVSGCGPSTEYIENPADFSTVEEKIQLLKAEIDTLKAQVGAQSSEMALYGDELIHLDTKVRKVNKHCKRRCRGHCHEH